MSKPEQILWTFLEHSNVDFRLTKAALIERYGLQAEYGFIKKCIIATPKPIFANLAQPIAFNISPAESIAGPAESFVCYIRCFNDAQKNFENAVEQLTAQFGPGKENSVSNTISRKWQFGRASITAVAWPPKLQGDSGTNEYHMAVPGSMTECTIYIFPAWLPAVSEQELASLEAYRPIFKGPLELEHTVFPSGIAYAKPEYKTLNDSSFGFNNNKTSLVLAVNETTIIVLPTLWIKEVNCHNSLPAKGSGGSFLSVTYWDQGLRNGNEQSLRLANKYSTTKQFDAIGAELATALQVPLKSTEDYDC